MEKRTILAVVLSVALITGSVLVQSIFFPPAPPEQPAPVATQPVAPAPQAETSSSLTAENTVSANLTADAPIELATVESPAAERTYRIDTDTIEAVFSNKGGVLLSYKLKKHLTDGKPVEMIFDEGSSGKAFALSFGDKSGALLTDLMNVTEVDPNTLEFYRTYFQKKDDGTLVPFTLRKRFAFKADEYLFQVNVSIENSVNEYPVLNSNGFAYTLSFGPQLGPRFEKLDNNYEYRKYYYRANGKRKDIKPAANSFADVQDRASWVSVIAKYFTLVAIPDAVDYKIAYSTVNSPDAPSVSALYFQRPVIKSAKVTDSFHFYIGPKTASELGRYNDPTRNGFKFQDIRIDDAMDYDNILGWLEAIMKVALQFFHSLIPNWGVAIILLTLLVKIVTFPLTHKSSEASARMQELQPKMQELQAKYKNNPQKLNAEMAEFYKKEGYNPMAGCLPMLIQIPLFFAMYNLFNNHFDLRGAMFIPGWIPDLSVPEAIFRFQEINLVLWKVSALRLLPIIYVASQLVYGKFTQQPGQQMNSQMKIMMYGMPIMFFFILYDAPSGLLVYWIASNLMTIVQQIAIKKVIAARKGKGDASEPRFVGKKKVKR